jgi:predicted HTH domain antitoxin
MDKRKVIHAYQRGLLSVKECAQLLGVDSVKVMSMVEDHVFERDIQLNQQTVNS